MRLETVAVFFFCLLILSIISEYSAVCIVRLAAVKGPMKCKCMLICADL